MIKVIKLTPQPWDLKPTSAPGISPVFLTGRRIRHSKIVWLGTGTAASLTLKHMIRKKKKWQLFNQNILQNLGFPDVCSWLPRLPSGSSHFFAFVCHISLVPSGRSRSLLAALFLVLVFGTAITLSDTTADFRMPTTAMLTLFQISVGSLAGSRGSVAWSRTWKTPGCPWVNPQQISGSSGCTHKRSSSIWSRAPAGR